MVEPIIIKLSGNMVLVPDSYSLDFLDSNLNFKVMAKVISENNSDLSTADLRTPG